MPVCVYNRPSLIARMSKWIVSLDHMLITIGFHLSWSNEFFMVITLCDFLLSRPHNRQTGAKYFRSVRLDLSFADWSARKLARPVRASPSSRAGQSTSVFLSWRIVGLFWCSWQMKAAARFHGQPAQF